MADIHFEIFDNADFGNKNLRFSEAPAQEQRDFLKQNGYSFTSRYGGVWYPRTQEAKNRNADFVKEFAEKFYPGNNKFQSQKQIDHLAEQALENSSAEIKSSSDDRIAYLENLIAELKEERKRDLEKISRLEAALENQNEENSEELEMRQEQAALDDEAEWEKENTLTDAEEKAYIEKQSETEIPSETIELTSEMLDTLHESAEKEALAEEPQAEKEILHAAEKSDDDLTVSPEDLASAKSVLPAVQYVSTLKFAQGEEREFFVHKIKEISAAVEKAPRINETDGLEEHRIVLRYFHPSGTQSFVTEIGKDGDAFGFQCLNDDWDNAEWGYLNLDELKNIRGMEVDFHVPAGMTVEKFIQKERADSFSYNDNFPESEMLEEDSYINSDEFISKFGDWNKANRLEKLRKSDPIEKDEKIILSGNDITSTVESLIENEDRKGLQSLEKEIGRTILGTYKNDDTGIFVNVSNRNVTEISNHHYLFKEHVQSLAYIPEIIEKATFIAEVENEDKERHPNIEKYLYFGTGLKLSGEDYTCKSVIGVDSSKNCYYDQSLSTIEKGKLVDYVMQNKKAGNLSLLITQRETDLEGNEMPYVYHDKRLISVCQVPQLSYMEKVNGEWKPTKEAIELVKTGRLHIEKNGQEYAMIEMDNEKPVAELSAEEVSRLSEEKYGFYFEYSDDENVADIYSAKDDDFVGSYGEGGFGYADDLSGNDPATRIPDENFREVLELAEIFYYKKSDEYENLIEAENGQMMNPAEAHEWNDEQKMQYSQENDKREAENANKDFETIKRLNEIVSEIKKLDFTLESKYENEKHEVVLTNKDGKVVFSKMEIGDIIPVASASAEWANDEASEKAKSLADEFFNLVCDDGIRGGDYVNVVFKREVPVEEDYETDLSESNISYTAENYYQVNEHFAIEIVLADSPLSSGKMGDDWTVRFYDIDYTEKFGEKGQFVTSYYASSILEHGKGAGLSLQGDVPAWTLDAETMDYVHDITFMWVDRHSSVQQNEDTEISREEVEQEKQSIQKKIQQLKDELNSPETAEGGLYHDEQQDFDVRKNIENLEALTDEDIKNQILWKRENQKKNDETHSHVVEQVLEEKLRNETPQEGELLSYNEKNPAYSVANKETKRETSIRPNGNPAENVKKLGSLKNISEANEIIGKIKSSGFDILSTESRIIIFDENKYYDFNAHADSGYFNYETKKFEFDLDKRNLNEWDFREYIKNGLKITKRMKDFAKIERTQNKKDYSPKYPEYAENRFVLETGHKDGWAINDRHLVIWDRLLNRSARSGGFVDNEQGRAAGEKELAEKIETVAKEENESLEKTYEGNGVYTCQFHTPFTITDKRATTHEMIFVGLKNLSDKVPENLYVHGVRESEAGKIKMFATDFAKKIGYSFEPRACIVFNPTDMAKSASQENISLANIAVLAEKLGTKIVVQDGNDESRYAFALDFAKKHNLPVYFQDNEIARKVSENVSDVKFYQNQSELIALLENSKTQNEKDYSLEEYWRNSISGMTMQDVKDGKVHIIDIDKKETENSGPRTKSSQKKIREQCREILKKTDSEITEADKQILAQYEGGGGLNEEERTNAEVLNAFYTPDNLIEKVWNLVDAYAPDAKSVLEPSAGVGRFAENRPDNEFTMHELDETSARINKILHPEADVIHGAFQKQFLDDGERFLKIGYEQPKYDVVIGNPPYGKYNDKYKGLGEGREFDRYEEYFIARGLDALKDEKSVLSFVVPSGFLNTASDKQKEIIASKGEILDAYRLPEGTFSTTKVGTDILIMRKKEGIDGKNISGELLSNGEWFKSHPEKILGEVKTRTNQFGKEEEYVAVHEGLSVQDELNKIDSFVAEIKKVNQPEKINDPLLEYSSDEENTEIISSPEIFTDEFAENITNFKKSLNDYFEKGIRPENDRFVIGQTPLVLQKIGSDVTEVTVPVSVIKKAVETHGLSQDEIFSSLGKMYNPVLIFDSDKNATENKVESKLIITSVFKDKNPIALAVNVNSDVKLKDSNISVEVQDIRSIHDRNVVAKNGTDLIQKWANDGLCRYVNDKKISEWSSLARVQFPIELLQSDSSNILTSTALVNSILSEQIPLKTDEQKQEDENLFETQLAEYNRKYWGAVGQEDTRYDVSPVTEERLSEIKHLGKELSEYFENGIRPENDRFVIGKTPRVLQETGSEYTDVTVSVAVIKKAVETHGLSEKEILNALTRLSTPILVFDSDKAATENKADSKLVLTDVFKDEKPVALAVNVNDSVQKQENGHRKQIEVQNIRSIHDRTVVAKNGVDLIQKWTTDGLCRYVDDKKITDWSTIARVQFPIEVLQSADSNILTRTALVNSVFPEQTPLEETEKTEPEKQNPSSSKTKKEKWNIVKSKGEVMSAEEFSHLYGRDFDEREFPIWKATDWQGNIDLAKLSGDDIRYLSESGKYVEKNIGEWTHKEIFASGDIYAKIQEQKELYEKSNGNKIFEVNIKILESAMKSPLEMERIHFGVKTALAESFTIEHIDAERNKVNLNLQESFILWAQNARLSDQKWRGDIDFATANISREELGEELSFYDIVNYIDGKPVKAEPVRGWRTYDMSEDEKAAEKAERRKEADLKRQARSDTANRLFDRYLHEGLSDADKTRLAAEYNRRFNSYVTPDYSKLPLFVDGMSAYKGDSKFKLYDQQIKGISFLCNKGNGLLAYDVGVGKTAAGIVATVNQIQTGRSSRPLIVVPNQVYSKWYTDIRQLFPNVKLNDLYNFGKDSVEKYIDPENLHRLNIPENSISLCTYEALKNITFTDESCENELYEDFASLLSADMDGSARENAESSDKIKGVIGSASHVKDESYFFYEDCGFDNLTVDEAHNFKNLWVVPRPKKKGESNEYAGIPSGKPSARALKMYGMTQLTQRHNDDRNVFMLTATPFTNSPTEVYSMLSYIGRERLKQAGITSLRAFFDEFAQTKQELGVTSTGNIDTKQIMKNWKELSALQNILTEFIDKVDGEEAGIIRPNKFTHVKPLDMSDLQKQMRAIDEERMAEVKEGNSAAVIVAMNNMRLSCVAPALANPAMYPGVELPPLSRLVETSPKLKFVCDAIIDMYKGNPEKGQFMYVPLGKESHGIIKNYLVAHGIPKNAVEIINGEVNNTPEKKEKITSCFNDEKNPCKIIIGGRNTAEGIDLNGNSFVMYNCSLGWNPSETIQAEGRIWRQGNLQGNVHIVYPVMNDSIDSVLYQKHDEKRSRINELWNYKGDSLNVEDINPEDLKLDLIKDPHKKAKLILQEETKEARAELSRLNLKIKSFDEIIEKRKQLEFDFSNAKETVDYQKEQIESYKKSGLEVPEWIKSELKDCNKKFAKAETGLEKVREKLTSLKITDSEKEAEYIRNLNNQKHACEEKINNIEKTLPQILKKLEIERMEQKLIEYPVEKQREILEADILNNLRPMKEVEYEIKTMRHEAMLSEKLKAGEITEKEFSLYKNAGYEKYEKWLNGEIESLEESSVKNEAANENSSIKNENDIEKIIVYYDGHWAEERGEKGKGWKYQEKSFDNPKDALDFYNTAKIPKDVGAENKNGFRFNFMNPEEQLLKMTSEQKNAKPVQNTNVSEKAVVEEPEQKDLKIPAEKKEPEKQPEQNMDSLYAEPGSLFFGLGGSDVLSVHSLENGYRKSVPYDDFSITERQLTESELKRDEIIFPVLNGKESGMYKSFKDFAEHGVFDVQGKSVELDDSGRISEIGWNQLQAAMEIYRNKKFETFRYVLIGREDGKIKDQLAVKSYSPNSCAVSAPDSRTIKQVITRAEELDCMIAAVHNHPSGNTLESSFDVDTTEALRKICTKENGQSRFAGHIILDHDTFNLYTPQNGWKLKLNSNAYGNSEDKLLNKNFAFSEDSVDYTWQLENVAKKINDRNSWNDNFIPVVFADSLNHVSGIKLYDKSFFDNEPQKIRNELQFSGLEANSVKAFPVITKNFAETMSAVDELLFEDKLKNLVEHSAFIDAALPESTVTEKFNILPGRQYFDVHGAKLKNPDIEATWQTRINPALFSEPEQKTMRKKEVAFER